MKKLAKLFGLQTRTVLYIILLLFCLASLTLTVLSIDFFVEYSSLPVGLVKASIGILILALIDDIVFNKIDTTTAIQEKNISYALIYLANAIIVAACISLA